MDHIELVLNSPGVMNWPMVYRRTVMEFVIYVRETGNIWEVVAPVAPPYEYHALRFPAGIRIHPELLGDRKSPAICRYQGYLPCSVIPKAVKRAGDRIAVMFSDRKRCATVRTLVLEADDLIIIVFPEHKPLTEPCYSVIFPAFISLDSRTAYHWFFIIGHPVGMNHTILT
jgi:hypothetical protein